MAIVCKPLSEGLQTNKYLPLRLVALTIQLSLVRFVSYDLRKPR